MLPGIIILLLQFPVRVLIFCNQMIHLLPRPRFLSTGSHYYYYYYSIIQQNCPNFRGNTNFTNVILIKWEMFFLRYHTFLAVMHPIHTPMFRLFIDCKIIFYKAFLCCNFQIFKIRNILHFIKAESSVSHVVRYHFFF